MCDENNFTKESYIYEILKTILILQKESNLPECCLDTCDKKCLGCTPSLCLVNTRPITLYLKGCCGQQLRMPISKLPNEEATSNCFRIEKLDNNTATFRVLIPTVNEFGDVSYTATNSFFTISLECICILKCLNDALVENL